MKDRAPSSRCRRWFARLLIFALAATLSFLLAEIGSRLLFREETVLFPRYHTGAQYGPYHLRRLRPSTTFRHTSIDGSWTFQTNAQGFRDTHDYAFAKPAGVRRVLCLGDSHTQGFEARQEQIFPAVLERCLARVGSSVEVLNAGISGFGTAEQLAFLESEGARYSPDVVVLAFFANDPDDSVKSGLFRVEDGALVAAKMEHVPGVAILDALNAIAPIRWLSEHSHFYSLLFNRVWEARKALLSRRTNAEVTAEYAAAPPSAAGGVTSYQRELVERLIQRMRRFCTDRGIRLVILDLPARLEDRDFRSSVPPELHATFAREADAFLPAEAILGSYRGVAEIFVPHGQQHISEVTHLLLGMALAEKIAPWLTSNPL